jgi:hypothetical protein
MDDLVYAVAGQGDAAWEFTLYRSTGRTGFVETVNVLDGTVPWNGQLIPLDVNGDGNMDFIHVGADASNQLVAQVLLNDGLRFTAGAPVETGLPYGGLVLPASLTASANPELLVLTHDSLNHVVLSAFRTSAAGLAVIEGVSQPPAGTMAGGNAMPLDLRGVGFSDFVYAVNASGTQRAFVMPAAGPYPDLMVSATNGVGGQYTASFASITDPSVYRSTGAVTAGMEPQALLHSAISGAGYMTGSVPWPTCSAAHADSEVCCRLVDQE